MTRVKSLVLSSLLLALSLVADPVAAQSARVTGRVTDAAGHPVVGARIVQKGTLNGVTSGPDGRYELRHAGGAITLVVSALGYRDAEVEVSGAATADVTLHTAVAIGAIEVVGTRRLDRTATNSPAAVDVIDLRELSQGSGQLDVNQLLQYAAPSFNASRQSGADGSDHIDPATLRGLGPDQTLVLINGKRRHQSSLINIFGTRGRGNTGTDLNAIPMAAIERIEILRDGASAQYGSDAIAGVINIVLRSSVNELNASLSTGARRAEPPSEFAVTSSGMDGEEVQGSLNYGWRAGREGYVNVTGEATVRERTNRPADPAQFDIYRRQYGDARTRQGGLFLNALLPVSERSGLYGFGGINFRHTDAYAWTRDPDSERNVPEIYPNGFDPRILSDIWDGSAAAGVRTKLGAWDLDVNNTFGLNRFHYNVHGTLNASLLAASPTEFDAGGFQLMQNVTGFSVSRLLPGVGAGLNVALGSEFRVDNYRIFAGEEGSWRNYGLHTYEENGEVITVDTLGRPGGSQGFPGFQPANELSENRTNVGIWTDLEMDVTRRLLVGVAGRYENYSDFGGTFNAKAATRLALSDALALRATASTGFRAPSLAQVHFNSTFTDFVSGVAVDKLIAANGSPITRAVGIPELKEETATNLSVGVTARAGVLTATVDAYQVDIDDRIVLTGAFEDDDDVIGEDLQALGVGAAQFFTNALDTRTRGIDVVLTLAQTLGRHRLNWSLAGNFNEMELGAIHTTPRLAGKEDIYFGLREQYFLRASAPPTRITLGLDHAFDRIEASARLAHYGRVVLIDWLDEPDVYESKRVLDVSLGYRVTDHAQLVLGATNLFNTYPTQQDTETETGGLWDAVQMGSAGTFVFARLNIRR